MNSEEYEAKYGIKPVPEWQLAQNPCNVFCYNASAIIYLYNSLCLLTLTYEDLIERSDNGYMIWLYEGIRSIERHTINILNVALEDRGINIRARIEYYMQAPALGRRRFLGNRHVLRLERPGIKDLIGADSNDITGVDNDEFFYRTAAGCVPKLAQWHMSYVDVDETYDIGFRKEITSPARYVCFVQREGKTTLSFRC